MTNTNHNLPQLFVYHIFAAKFGGRSQDNKIGKVISMSESVESVDGSYVNICLTYPDLLLHVVTLYLINQVREGKV